MKESILLAHGLQATVCEWSGMPIVVACNFQFCSLGTTLAKRHHPIFNANLTELMRAVPATLSKGNDKEQHLLALALCYTANLWDFRGVFKCTDEKSHKLLKLVIETIQIAIHSPIAIAKSGRKEFQYPRLVVSAGTTYSEAINHLKLIKDVLGHRAPLTEAERLDWEVELEAELNAVLQTNRGYRDVYGRNAVQALKDAWVRGKVSECDWKLVELCLNVERQPSAEQLIEGIELLKEFYPERDDFERADGLKVIRHLESRLELIRKQESDLGFIEIVSVKGAGTASTLGASYTVKTGSKATDVQAISKDVEAEVKAEWALTGRSYRTLDLLMEVKRRQRALTESQAILTIITPTTPTVRA